jgi:hypothetical protein
MILKIDGVDIVPYIAHGGFKWQRSDVDGNDAGRDLNGDLRRNRVATKRRLDITCKPLTTGEASAVLSAIMPEWVTVEYLDPQAGTVLSRVMYSNNNPASYLLKQPNGTELWGGITFPLIEK